MSRLMPVDWKKFEKFLFKSGCTLDRQKGDHRIYKRKGLIRPIVIPMVKQLPIFIIKNNLRILNISVDEYLKKI